MSAEPQVPSLLSVWASKCPPQRSPLPLPTWLTNCLSVAADYTSSVATKYLKRGFRAATSSKSLVVLLLSMAVSVALELANMAQKGELQRLWAVAKQTDLTFNLVSSRGEVPTRISVGEVGSCGVWTRSPRVSSFSRSPGILTR